MIRLSSYLCFLLILVGVVFSGCRQKLRAPRVERDVLAPVAKTKLSLNQILADSLVEENGDGSLSLVFREDFASFTFDTLVDIPNSEFNRTTKISTLTLDNKLVQYRISLGMIAQNWPIWGPLIIANNGATMSLPDITGVTAGPYDLSIDDIFQTATFDSGYVDITVTNNFPVAVGNVQFQLSNKSDNSVVIVETYNYIAAGASETITVDASGLTIEGNLIVDILNLDILGGNQTVQIDTSDDLLVDMLIRDIKLQSATAIFPAQNLIDEKVTTPVDIKNAKLRESRVKTGNVVIEVTSTIEDSIYFYYTIPVAIRNGLAFETNVVIPPAPSGGSISRQYQYDFSNYDLSLAGEMGNQSNVIYSELSGRIDSTGRVVTLSKEDSLLIRIYTEDIVPEYVEGFLGSEVIEAQKTDYILSVFENVISGELDLEKVNASIVIENSVGMEGALYISNLTAENVNSGAEVALSGNNIQSFNTIASAKNNTITPVESRVLVDETNSNIRDFIKILPNRLSYDVEAHLNYGIDTLTTDFQDFITDSSQISSALEITMPLSLIASQLTLQDTTDFALDISTDNLEGLSGRLNLIAYNGFPLTADLKIRFLDEDEVPVDSLETTSTIQRGVAENGKIVELVRTVNSFDLNIQRIENLKNATNMVVTAVFDSESMSHEQIYPNYELNIVITTELNTTN